jgi:hypothetical protein
MDRVSWKPRAATDNVAVGSIMPALTSQIHLPGFTALAAALAAVSLAAACSPVAQSELDDSDGDSDGNGRTSRSPSNERAAAPTSSSSSSPVAWPGVGASCGDLLVDPHNCGTCGSACAATQACEQGVCVNQLTDCAAEGSCQDATCTEKGRYSVDELIAVDLANDRLVWQRAHAVDLDFAQATEYCASLELDGITGWRLPDGAESRSIVFRSGGLQGCPTPEYCAPAIDQAVFPDTAVDLYWISQPYTSGMHFSRSFCDGRSTPYKEDDSALHYVRCVHDPLPGGTLPTAPVPQEI